MKNATACRDIDLTPEEFAALCARVDDRSLQDRDYEVLRIILDSYGQLAQAYREKGASIKRLLKMLFGAPTEKTNNVLKRAAGSDGGEAPAADGSQEDAEKPAGPKRVGHGCNGAAAYTGAERVHVAIEGLKAGDSCPECSKGTVYEYRQPGVAVRVVGQPPLKATVYELQKLRCGSCGALFTADMPKEAGSEKYDATAATAIGTLKYGYGFPFNRLQKLEANLGVPVPAAVQWEQVDKAAAHYVPVYRELVRQGAQGDVVYNDDTPMKVIALMQESATADCGTEDVPARTGVFTTGVVSTVGRHTVALFFTGRQHAGENLADVLQHRSEDLAPPIQMCDAASRNTPKDFKVILANCSAHYLESDVIRRDGARSGSHGDSVQRATEAAPDNWEPGCVLRSLNRCAKENCPTGSKRCPRAARHPAVANERHRQWFYSYLHYLDTAVPCPPSRKRAG
jgi:transposase